MDARLAIDSTVLLLYFALIIAVGLYMGRKEENLEDFALGGRRMPWWAVLASLIAAETTAATYFGAPGEGFTFRNYTYLQLALGTILARILVSYIFIKPYYDYKVFSIYEYLTARFGVATKNAASAVFMFTRVLASGARLYVAAIALVLAYELIRGTRPGQTETLLIYIGATVVIVILTAIYTTIGGIKAVVWTDFIQASIMMGSALVALGLLYSAIPGGWHEIAQRHGGFHLSDFIATGFTRDWYEPYINPGATGEQSLRAVRWATVWFSVLMIAVASTTSYLVIVHPNVRIIPIVLGIFGYTYGSLLGVFLCGMFTKRRGNDLGNIIAMIIGFIVVAILSGLPNKIAGLFGGKLYTQPSWLPVMEFPWWICFGTIVTFSVAVLFRSGGGDSRPARTE